MRSTAFDRLHPACAAVIMAAILVVTFVCLSPALVATSLVLAFVYSAVVSGARTTLRGLIWQIPLLIIIGVINPLFSAQGSTLLGTPIPGHPIYFESLVFGILMGALLVAVLIWFGCVSRVLSSDKLMGLAAGRLPTLSLMLSMTLRLVPQLVSRGRLIAQTEQACTAGGGTGTGLRAKTSSRLRQVSVLMGWSMEESLETADSMKARGWGTGRRTSYTRTAMRRRDWCWTLAALVLLVIVIAGYITAGTCSFYPVLDLPCPWWLYAAYALLCALPLVAELVDRLQWSWS